MARITLLVILTLGLFGASELDALKRPCPSICPQYYVPVCASNGKTYGNICIFRVAACKDPSIRLAKRGVCGDTCLKACTKHYDPHCGNDGKTYGNKCMLEIGQCKNPALKLFGKGACIKDKPCFGVSQPLKNNKGKTLCCGRCSPRDTCPSGSSCHIHPTDLFSVCCRYKAAKECDKVCIALHQPICGSDGKTYSNRCDFNVAKCKNPRLKIVKYGRCTSSVKPGKCPRARPCRHLPVYCQSQQKRDRCQSDSQCRGTQKCCPMRSGKRCSMPCPVHKCRACQRGYRYAIGRNACPTCRCVCRRVSCYNNPCPTARCPRFPRARCRANYCGGCFADFYDRGRKVNCRQPPTKG